MMVVVFEFALDPEKGTRYFELAQALRPEVEKIPGFISVERFESLTRPGRFVSVSFWQDEEAVLRWRRHAEHAKAQAEAIAEGLFTDFRITVAEARRSYTLEDVRKARTAMRPEA